jgi:hypothetical protein
VLDYSAKRSGFCILFFSCFYVEDSELVVGTQRLPRLVGLQKALEMMLVSYLYVVSCYVITIACAGNNFMICCP